MHRLRWSVRVSLPSLERRLPELAIELAELARLVERQDHAAAIAKIYRITEQTLHAMCREHQLVVEQSSSIDMSLDALEVPVSIEAHVRTVQAVVREDASAIAADDALSALIGVLEWRIGSRSASVVSLPPPAKLRRASRLVIACSAIGGVAAATIVVALLMRHDSTEPARATEDMVRIAGATFDMGSRDEELKLARSLCTDVEQHLGTCDPSQVNSERERVRRVAVSPFDLDRVEVTVAKYAEWLNTMPLLVQNAVPNIGMSPTTRRFTVQPGREQLAVTGIPWTSAHAYCQAHRKRLPTEAEWELAARGPLRRMFPWGNTLPTCEDVVFARIPGRDCEASGAPEPAPVGSAPLDVTPEGVHDLAGSVSEWTEDAARERPICAGPCVDPRIEGGADERRVVRGGNWAAWLGSIRGATRLEVDPAVAKTTIGFRCAASAR